MASSNISAVVVDGKLQTQTASSASLSAATVSSNTSLDKDAFLQLLVAQMKYQDPLEPTDNTEYISQLATFSELEEMQNLNSGMSLQRASGLIGENVICKVTNASTGNTEYVSGRVDYVVYENNKAYVSIDEALYSVDDIYEVVDEKYTEAYNLAKQFVAALASFPKVDQLTTEYADAVSQLRDTYDGMDSYQKTFIATDVLELLKSYEQKIAELKLGQEAEKTAADGNAEAADAVDGE